MPQPNRPAGHVKSKAVAAVCIAVVLLAAPLLGGWSALSGPDGANEGTVATLCAESSLLGDAPAPGSPEPVSLQLRPSQKTSLAFGRSMSKRTRTLQFDVPAEGASRLQPYSRLAADFDPFVRDDDAELKRRMMAVQAEYRDGRVRLTLCADRAGAEPLGDPGTYVGTVSIVDARVSRVDIPFTITLAYPGWPIVVDIGLLTVFVAVWWVWLLALRNAGQSASFADWLSWLFRVEGILACGLGVVAAAGAFATVYLKSTTWSLDALQIAGLAAAVFSAFVAASSATRVGQYVAAFTENQNVNTPGGGATGGGTQSGGTQSGGTAGSPRE